MNLNAMQASRVIVGVAQVKLDLMKQKMARYKEAENQGTDQTLRSKRLLSWVATLSFLRKFDELMTTDKDIQKIKNQNYLKNLAPPPPPPPAGPPPDDEDEE